MGIFNRLFGGKPAPADPVGVRDALLAAANRGDRAAVRQICVAHRGLIAGHFAEWSNMKAYGEIDPKDNRQIQYVINGLGTIAELFKNELADPSLWNRLIGGPQDNPMIRFEKLFAEAKSLAAAMQYQQAIDMLSGFLIDTGKFAGPGADNFRAYSHGLIGMSLFQSNHAADAIDHLRKALEFCGALGDAEGVNVYHKQLYDAYRYLGQADAAALHAEKLAATQSDPSEAELWRQRSALVRAGEPLVRMVARQGDRVVELDQLQLTEGQTTFLFERNRPTLIPSQKLAADADRTASAEKLDEALSLYRDAMKADPFNPQPHYNAGITLVLLQRYAEAIEEYQTTAALAPGWFNTNGDLWLAGELLAGRLSHEAFFAIWFLENGNLEPAKKLEIADQALEASPSLPHLHLHRARALADLSRKDQAIAALKAGLACAPEPDIRSRLQVQLAVNSDEPARRELCEEVMNDVESNLMSRTMARTLVWAKQG